MDRSISLTAAAMIAGWSLPALAAVGQEAPADLLQSLLITSFFLAPLLFASLLGRVNPSLPERSLLRAEDLHVTEAIGPEEADEFIRQPALQVVVDGEPEVREPIRPKEPRKSRHAA